MSMAEVMHNSMMPYAEHVILERALPRVEDGLKPVQRRILYTMLELNLTPDKPHRKMRAHRGRLPGQIPSARRQLAFTTRWCAWRSHFSMREQLVDGHGNFGSIDGDSAAAMRYTEARMTAAGAWRCCAISKRTPCPSA